MGALNFLSCFEETHGSITPGAGSILREVPKCREGHLSESGPGFLEEVGGKAPRVTRDRAPGPRHLQTPKGLKDAGIEKCRRVNTFKQGFWDP